MRAAQGRVWHTCGVTSVDFIKYNVIDIIGGVIGNAIGRSAKISIDATQITNAAKQHGIEITQDVAREAAKTTARFEGLPTDDTVDTRVSAITRITDDERALLALIQASQLRILANNNAPVQNKIDSSIGASKNRALTIIRAVGGESASRAAQAEFASLNLNDSISASDLRHDGTRALDTNIPRLAISAIDALHEVGKVSESILERIENNKWLKYAFLALDIASGPVMFAATSAISLVAGGVIANGFNKAIVAIGENFIDADIDFERVHYATLGALTLGALALGARKSIRYAGDVRATLNRSELKNFSPKAYFAEIRKSYASQGVLDIPDNIDVDDVLTPSIKRNIGKYMLYGAAGLTAYWQRPTWVYRLESKSSGEILKFGISYNPDTRYSAGELRRMNAHSPIRLQLHPTRLLARIDERIRTLVHKRVLGHRLPESKYS